jgi:hypothetical protein
MSGGRTLSSLLEEAYVRCLSPGAQEESVARGIGASAASFRL